MVAEGKRRIEEIGRVQWMIIRLTRNLKEKENTLRS